MDLNLPTLHPDEDNDDMREFNQLVQTIYDQDQTSRTTSCLKYSGKNEANINKIPTIKKTISERPLRSSPVKNTESKIKGTENEILNKLSEVQSMEAAKSMKDEGDQEKLSNVLSSIYDRSTQEIMNAFTEWKKDCLEKNMKSQISIQELHNREISELEDLMENLRNQLRVKNLRSKHTSKLIFNLSSYISHLKIHEKCFWSEDQSVRYCFLSWNSMIRRVRINKVFIDRSRNHYNKKLKRIVFSGWIRLVNLNIKENIKSEYTKKMEDSSRSLVCQYEIELDKMRKQLEVSQKEADLCRRQESQMEDDLRRVFLKGVSAMNLEALNVFSGQRNPLSENRKYSSLNYSVQYGKNTDDSINNSVSTGNREFLNKESEEHPRTAIPVPSFTASSRNTSNIVATQYGNNYSH